MRIVRPGRSDIAVVSLLLLVTVLPYVLASSDHGVRWAAYLGMGLLQVVPLLWRRAAPVAVFAAVVLGCFLQLWVSDMVAASDIGLLVAYYTVVVRRGWRWTGVAATAVCGVGAILAGIDWSGESSRDTDLRTHALQVVFIAFMNALCVAVTGAVAEAGRRRMQLLEQLRARAVAAEHERDQQRVIAAQEERTRIAREMHDVVAHALAVIVVQADGAGHALSRSADPPPVAVDALGSIGDTARQALAETRALVGVLRAGAPSAELAPTSTLADLPELVERLAGAGRRIQLDTGGIDLTAVPPGVGRATLRVAQEGVTNSLKHAGPQAQVWIRLCASEESLTLTVEDDGRGSNGIHTDGGSGLIGMRERVAAHGGRLRLDGRPGQGFRVEAEMPWDRETSKTVGGQRG